ncbi:hypothetical protein ATSB10_14880 [Dyella thiooxydans]|uniref:Uncharacterized protein n=1 Tax=Dyella thiooxydans TaxID=445710 RepID=A0A160N1C8_9GAMM|nr:hypothetical protein ATSB10_14880 [Dyella thiooxydans]
MYVTGQRASTCAGGDGARPEGRQLTGPVAPRRTTRQALPGPGNVDMVPLLPIASTEAP